MTGIRLPASCPGAGKGNADPWSDHGAAPAGGARLGGRGAEVKINGFLFWSPLFHGLSFPKDMTESEPQTRHLGYARVSTYGQTLGARLEQLRANGCAKIFREKARGARADRTRLLRLLKGLAPGEVVTVTRIDRLARSTFDLFAIVKRIVDAGGQFRSLAEPWADTSTSTGRGETWARTSRVTAWPRSPEPAPHVRLRSYRPCGAPGRAADALMGYRPASA